MRWGDVFWTTLAALSQLGTSYLGWKVAGTNLTLRQRRWYDALFVSIGLIGVVAVGVIAYSAGRQERAHFATSIGSTYPQFFLVDRPLAFNVAYKNTGSGTAHNVTFQGRSTLQPDGSLANQRRAISEFKEWVETSIDVDGGTTLLTKDSPEVFATARGPILSPEDLASLRAGRRTVIVVATISFTDDFGNHVRNVCYILQQPLQAGPAQVFGSCREHNSEE